MNNLHWCTSLMGESNNMNSIYEEESKNAGAVERKWCHSWGRSTSTTWCTKQSQINTKPNKIKNSQNKIPVYCHTTKSPTHWNRPRQTREQMGTETEKITMKVFPLALPPHTKSTTYMVQLKNKIQTYWNALNSIVFCHFCTSFSCVGDNACVVC